MSHPDQTPQPVRTTSPAAADPGSEAAEDQRVEAIVERGPGGTFMVAGIATVIVVATYFAFYFFAYLPRGVVH